MTVIETFPGLNLADDPEEVGANGAIDLLNVDFDDRGRVRSRDGYALHSTGGGGAASYARLEPTPAKLLAYRQSGTSVYIDRMQTSGSTIANVGSWAGVSAPYITSTASLGTPTSTLTFFASYVPVANATLRVYDGSTIATSTGLPRFVAVTPVDNRLVQAMFTSAVGSPTGANGSTSTVVFSDAGAPETYSANNYVHLHPGDGEVIRGMVAWRDLLFVFKSTKMFVFYGTSTDATGNPIFNYRTVDIPPLRTRSDFAGSLWHPVVISCPDGVYFSGAQGIYRTTGGPPVAITDPIQPMFTDRPGDDFKMDVGLSLAWAGRLIGEFTNADTEVRSLANDARGNWTLWSFPTGVTNPVQWASGGDDQRPDVFIANSASIYKITSGQATDDGAAIAAHYQSGFYDLGEPGKDAYTRYTRLWGSGAPTVSVFTDLGTTDSNAAAVTLGTLPATAEGYHQKSYKGRLFSHKLASSSAFSVNRLSQDVNWVRP